MRYVPIVVGLFGLLLLPRAGVAQDDAFSIRGLVVTASPLPREESAVAHHVTVLDGEELRLRGIASVAEALRDVSGVDVVRSGSFGAVTSVFMRGGESDYTLVLVDGVQVNVAGGGFDFASLTTENVERIEILRGPASALYGSDAIAGVIHVVTRSGRGAPAGGVRMETASYDEARGDVLDGIRWSADVAGGTERSAYALALGRGHTEGVLDFNNRHTSTVLAGSARFVPDDRTSMALTLRLADRVYHYPTDGTGAIVDRNAFTYNDETLGRVSVVRAVSERVELEAVLGLSETDGGTDDGQDGPADTLGFYGFRSLDHFRRASGELRAHLTVGPGVVTAGWELEEERQRSFSSSLSQFGASSADSETHRSNRAGFVHLVGGKGRVSMNGGARFEDNERFGAAGTWQLGVAVVMGGERLTRLRGSIGTGIKEPTFYENFATGFAVGNPALEPERSRSWDVGVEHRLPGDAAKLSATFFRQSFENLIQYTFLPLTPGGPNFDNVAAARARGLEVEAEVRWRGVRGGGAWSWLGTEVVDSGFDEGAGAAFVEGERLLRRPGHTLSLFAARHLGSRGNLRTGVSLVGERSDRDFTTYPATPVALPRHTLWSVGADWRLSPRGFGRSGVTLSIRGENLLDRRYDEVFGYRAPGRQLYLGASVGFGGGS